MNDFGNLPTTVAVATQVLVKIYTTSLRTKSVLLSTMFLATP